MKKNMFLLLFSCLPGCFAFAQGITGKWQWIIQGSGQDIQADYLVELDLKQEGSRVYGLRTLFLKNFEDIIIKVEGKLSPTGELFLDTREVVQCSLPDTILVAKSFSYRLNFRPGSKRMDGIFYPREDTAKRRYRIFDPGFYDAIYASSFSSPFRKLADTLTAKASTIMGIKPDAAPPKPKPLAVITTETQHRITIPEADVSIDMYDNGDVDGDSITLLVNNKIVLEHQKLSVSAIRFNLKKEDLTDSTTIIMRAENLGRIPPNTALMLLTAAGKRYDLRLSSDLKKQAAVVLYKKK